MEAEGGALGPLVLSVRQKVSSLHIQCRHCVIIVTRHLERSARLLEVVRQGVVGPVVQGEVVQGQPPAELPRHVVPGLTLAEAELAVHVTIEGGGGGVLGDHGGGDVPQLVRVACGQGQEVSHLQSVGVTRIFSQDLLKSLHGTLKIFSYHVVSLNQDNKICTL